MNKLTISEEKLLTEYNIAIDRILDDLDWKTSFSAQEICSIVYGILMNNKVKILISEDKLLEKYSNYIDSLGITRDEWVNKYGIPEIIGIIYKILEKNC